MGILRNTAEIKRTEITPREPSSECSDAFRCDSIRECEEYFELEAQRRNSSHSDNRESSSQSEQTVRNGEFNIHSEQNTTGHKIPGREHSSDITDFTESSSGTMRPEDFMRDNSNDAVEDLFSFSSSSSCDQPLAAPSLLLTEQEASLCFDSDLSLKKFKSSSTSLSFSHSSFPFTKKEESIDNAANNAASSAVEEVGDPIHHPADSQGDTVLKDRTRDKAGYITDDAPEIISRDTLQPAVAFLQELLSSIDEECLLRELSSEELPGPRISDISDCARPPYGSAYRAEDEFIYSGGTSHSKKMEDSYKESPDDFYYRQESNPNFVESGFTTGNNKKIFIDPCLLGDAPSRTDSALKNGATEESDAEHVENPVQNTSSMQNNSSLQEKTTPIHFGLSSQNSDLFHFPEAKGENLQVSGFVTGNNKKIYMDTAGLLPCRENNENFNSQKACEKDCGIKTPLRNLALEASAGVLSTNQSPSNRLLNSNPPIGSNRVLPYMEALGTKGHTTRSCNMPGPGHSSTAARGDQEMRDVYRRVCEFFAKEEDGWVFAQFKWTWLYLFAKGEITDINKNAGSNASPLYDKTLEIMRLRKRYEHSVLRRIVEFDDTPSKFTVLGIISYSSRRNESIKESSSNGGNKEAFAYAAEVFDGFYSVEVVIDENIFNLFKKANCALGSKIFVFGAQILLKNPASIFEISGPVLRLFYNSTKVVSNDFPLGPCRRVSFLNTVSQILMEGGPVSCLIVRIKKIVEIKFLVTIETYRNRVDDLEKEVEKIAAIAERQGHVLDKDSIRSCQYAKVLVGDETGECLLTWWNPPELKTGETYKFIYLTPVANSLGIHVSASKRTFWELVK